MSSAAAPPAPPSLPSYSCVNVSLRDCVCWLELNRPQRKNAFNTAQYNELVQALDWCARLEAVHVVVLTGSPHSKPIQFYSSGNDLGNFMGGGGLGGESGDGDMKSIAHAACVMVERFVDAFIRFPKVLIGAVNGPAHGIAVTSLLLCDLLYTNEEASFTTPFTALGQNPEGCSSVLFHQRMGQKANRMLLLGETLSAAEADRLNFSTGVFPNATFLRDVHAIAVRLANFPLHSVMASKQLVRRQEIDALVKANQDEARVLEEMLNDPRTMEAVINKLQEISSKPKRSKL